MTDQELIKALKAIKVEIGSLACEGCGHEHNCGVHGCAIMRSAADRLEELGQRVPRWIPVTERLPDDDDGDWCLVYADGQEGSLVYLGAVICADYDWTTGNFFDGSICITNLVRYWMPMPEAPEREKL
jgi:hypothetical protein